VEGLSQVTFLDTSRTLLLVSGFFCVLLQAAILPVYAQGVDGPMGRGAELYQEACAACHGPDGGGMDVSRVGFDIPLPDFTDCQFASREPDGDWLAVIHDGGPARAFDRMMPAFGGALTPPELEAILARVRTFCQNGSWPRGELNLPRPLVTEKAYPEDEAVLEMSAATEGTGAITHQLVYERRFGPRNQFEIVVPHRIEERGSGSWRGGIGDVAVAVKRALWHSFDRGSILSVAGEVILPTGDQDKGFGKGVTVFEPFLAFGQILPRDSFVQFQGGFELPVDSERSNEGFWRTAVGKTLNQGAYGRSWTPMVEVLGSRELTPGATVDWDLVPQVQVSLSTRQHVLLNAGLRIPINDSGPRTTTVMFYLLWDWFDGGLLSGW
jgi:hypothetical protein